MKTQIFSDGLEGHKRRSLDRAKRLQKGERLKAEKIITFADPLDMISCLTVERVRLVQTVRKKPFSITSLAVELGRNRTAVTRDVKTLTQFGLLRLREQTNPGHGIIQIVESVARKLAMRTDI